MRNKISYNFVFDVKIPSRHYAELRAKNHKMTKKKSRFQLPLTQLMVLLEG